MIMFLFYIFDGTSNVACKRLLEFSEKFRGLFLIFIMLNSVPFKFAGVNGVLV